MGIAALEDKVVQHAVGKVLNQIGEEDLLSGLQLRIPPGAQTAGGLGRAEGRDRAQASELDSGPGHSILFRQTPARLTGQVCGASGRRPAYHPPDPKVAEGGGDGARAVNRDEGGSPPGASSRPCWPTSTCIRSWISGLSRGGRSKRAGMSSSCVMPTTPCSGSSTESKRSASWNSCGKACGSSGWNCTRRRRA